MDLQGQGNVQRYILLLEKNKSGSILKPTAYSSIINEENEDGSAGSGNWGHAGRPGIVGGSMGKGYNASAPEKSGRSEEKGTGIGSMGGHSGKAEYRLEKPEGSKNPYSGTVWAYRANEEYNRAKENDKGAEKAIKATARALNVPTDTMSGKAEKTAENGTKGQEKASEGKGSEAAGNTEHEVPTKGNGSTGNSDYASIEKSIGHPEGDTVDEKIESLEKSIGKLQPGDTVTWGTETFTVVKGPDGNIAYEYVNTDPNNNAANGDLVDAESVAWFGLDNETPVSVRKETEQARKIAQAKINDVRYNSVSVEDAKDVYADKVRNEKALKNASGDEREKILNEIKEADPCSKALGSDAAESYTERAIDGKNISGEFQYDESSSKTALEQVAEQQGFNRAPLKMDRAHFAMAVENTGMLGYRSVYDDLKSADEMISEMTDKDFIRYNYGGGKAYGAGLYFTMSQEGKKPVIDSGAKLTIRPGAHDTSYNESRNYGNRSLAVTLEPNAKIADGVKLMVEYRKMPMAERARFGYDVGAYIASKGYDGARWDNAGWNCDYITVYNRTKLIALDDKEAGVE